MMLFVYMGVLIMFDDVLFNVISEVGNVLGWKEDVFCDIIVLGSNMVFIFVMILVVGVLVMVGEKKKVLIFLIVVVVGIVMIFLFKVGIDRFCFLLFM